MEDSMIDRPSMAFDEKVGNKRDRDGEEEMVLGRLLEKRPSGTLGVSNGVDEGGQNGGIIDTFISNVFHKNESVTKEECEVDSQVKNDVIDIEVENKGDGLGVDESVWNVANGGHEEGEGGGGGIIKDFFSNIFKHNGNDDNNGDQGKNDLDNEVVDKDDELGTIDGNFENGGGELKDLNAEKLVEKHDVGSDLLSKDLEGNKLKMKPDDYSERVFFLNNN